MTLYISPVGILLSLALTLVFSYVIWRFLIRPITIRSNKKSLEITLNLALAVLSVVLFATISNTIAALTMAFS